MSFSNPVAALPFLRRRRGLLAAGAGLAVTAVLVFVVMAPNPHTTTLQAKEATLRQDLYMMRSTMAQYTRDNRKAPQSLNDLVRAGYIKFIPVDPLTGNNDTWRVDPSQQDTGGIQDVHSGSPLISSDGTSYSSW